MVPAQPTVVSKDVCLYPALADWLKRICQSGDEWSSANMEFLQADEISTVMESLHSNSIKREP